MGARVRTSLLPALLMSLCLAGCAGQSQPAQSPHDSTTQAQPVVSTPVADEGGQGPCLEAWTYAPGNFVLDVAGGADVFLVPEVQDFPLFCSASQARTALHNGIAQGDLPDADGGWAIYKVEGVFHDIARAVGYDNYVLKRQARLADWSY